MWFIAPTITAVGYHLGGIAQHRPACQASRVTSRMFFLTSSWKKRGWKMSVKETGGLLLSKWFTDGFCHSQKGLNINMTLETTFFH